MQKKLDVNDNQRIIKQKLKGKKNLKLSLCFVIAFPEKEQK
jgi:hypothetical protein